MSGPSNEIRNKKESAINEACRKINSVLDSLEIEDNGSDVDNAITEAYYDLLDVQEDLVSAKRKL